MCGDCIDGCFGFFFLVIPHTGDLEELGFPKLVNQGPWENEAIIYLAKAIDDKLDEFI